MLSPNTSCQSYGIGFTLQIASGFAVTYNIQCSKLVFFGDLLYNTEHPHTLVVLFQDVFRPRLEKMLISLQASQNFPPVWSNFPLVWHISLTYFFSQNHKISRQEVCQIAHFFPPWWCCYQYMFISDLISSPHHRLIIYLLTTFLFVWHTSGLCSIPYFL